MNEDAALRAASAFLAGGGEMGLLMRTHEWSATPPGPIGAWSQSLKTVASLVLSGSFPMIAPWGDDLVEIYNDGCRRPMGSKHPAGLGQRTRSCWPVAISTGPERICELFNAACARLVGLRDLVGKTVREALPDIESQGFHKLLDGVFAINERHVAERVPVRMRRTPGAGPEERLVDLI